jgi:type IV secretory pathway ATPase VirB11/archaellum biosynthesis ATPase
VFLEGREVERLISILRFTSCRPFSEADPVLECDLSLFKARITAVSPPLSPGGISIAIRKHSHDPWTLLRLIGSGSIDSHAAAFLDICIDGRSTMLIAGPRGAGKSSLLGALLFDIDPSSRIITIEDTPELPLSQLKSEGYNVLGLTVEDEGRSTAEKALRTALRLGESVLVLGEVRGPETRILYEAMSAGTAGSSVLGTFHADSSSSVYKRAVNDLGVSPGSFSATDIVVICGLVQPRGLRTRYRKVVQISEYQKTGEPGRFRDLFVYDPDIGGLVPSQDISSSFTLRRISSLWGLEPREILEDLQTRRLVFDHALGNANHHLISRPETMVRVLNTLREAREVTKGEKGPRLFKEWKKRIDFGNSEDWDS